MDCTTQLAPNTPTRIDCATLIARNTPLRLDKQLCCMTPPPPRKRLTLNPRAARQERAPRRTL
eukprot:1736170-Pyramimonas_sp.AAC.1